jgi:hypothetical protein
MNTEERYGNSRGAEQTDGQNQFLCKGCRNYKQTLEQKNNLKYYWEKECNRFDCQISKAKIKCQGKYFVKKDKSKNNMKVVKMIAWEDAQKYPQCDEQDNYKDFWDCVKNFLIEKNIKFNGYWHQGWKYGAPLVEYEGKIYAFAVSMRRWGQIMADAFDPGNKDPLSYVDWAFQDPDGEIPTVNENRDPLL